MNSSTSFLPVLAIVIPCYNEELALPETIKVLRKLMMDMQGGRMISDKSYILCVDDGSSDRTWDRIKALKRDEKDIIVRGISLSHNRGHQYALLAGLTTAMQDCDAAVSIDADLQDDPRAIKDMLSMYREGAEIVYGVRASRTTDTWFKRNSARLFYRLQSAMGLQTIYDHADYRLMSRRALEILGQYKESNLFLRGIVPQIGLQTSVVRYDRSERVAGESKYPLRKMISFSVDGITSFTAKPIRWIFLTGLWLLVIDVFICMYVLGAYFFGTVVGGWTSLMLSVWFLGSLILMAIGIVGEYIGKIFIEVKGRPRYNIKEKI